MTIAITGATGFVGQAVLDVGTGGRHAMRALTRRPQTPRGGVAWVEGSLDDATSLARLVKGADAVLHIAGLTSAVRPEEFDRVNVEGTARVIDAARGAGAKRLIFVSSLSAREPGLSVYGGSKNRAEALVKDSALDWTIVRPPAVYGPRDREMFELFRAAQSGIVPLPPRGRASLIHVEDLARLLVALAGAGPEISGTTLEPDDGRSGGYAHRDLAQLIGQAVGRRRVFAPHLPKALLMAAARADRLVRGRKAKLTPDRAGYMAHPDWVCDPAKAPPAAFWTPRLEGGEGMAATAAWYREQGWL
ncbi:NAD-dependent epimerase/dehydratase family protein [Qipengyuania spongiae]|uniref:NAD(P)H-binding protein n=1 Tax=Qipengyuania spongiae TaxID=2909673 RepID=A0ABY5T145_9SPHN|nr:NAD-dependent epimerase/dehydratase family protein [Qipengyuania spongiae]UVI40498.1 NAD(P)H-binding protein [Qipengyuania spongiae]